MVEGNLQFPDHLRGGVCFVCVPWAVADEELQANRESSIQLFLSFSTLGRTNEQSPSSIKTCLVAFLLAFFRPKRSISVVCKTFNWALGIGHWGGVSNNDEMATPETIDRKSFQQSKSCAKPGIFCCILSLFFIAEMGFVQWQAKAFNCGAFLAAPVSGMFSFPPKSKVFFA